MRCSPASSALVAG